MMDILLNALIFLLTLVLTIRFFRKDGSWNFCNGAAAFRFFTVQSNVLCAVAALLMCFAPSSAWVWTVKYIGTVAVTVTMLTVFLFLGPNIGYKKLLSGSDLYMHLVTPLLAILSFACLERRELSFKTAMLGMLPVFLYGILYLYKVVLAPEGKRWDDFYYFNNDGKWPLSFVFMMIGCFAVCLLFLFVQSR